MIESIGNAPSGGKICIKKSITDWNSAELRAPETVTELLAVSWENGGSFSWCTVYDGKTLVKPFFDFDDEYHADDPPSTEEVEELYSDWKAHIFNLFKSVIGKEFDIAAATRTRKKDDGTFKVSQRLVVQGLCMTVQTVSAFAQMARKWGQLEEVLDISVYKAGRHGMACVGCRKWPESQDPDEVMRPLTDHRMGCFVETIVADLPIYSLHPDILAKHAVFNAGNRVSTMDVSTPHTVDMGRLAPLLPLIKSSDYAKWVAVGMNIKAALGETGLGIFVEWSRAQPGYVDDEDVAERWRSFEPTSCGTGVTALQAKARRDSPEEYAQLQADLVAAETQALTLIGERAGRMNIFDGVTRPYEVVKVEFEKTRFFSKRDIAYCEIQDDDVLGKYSREQFKTMHENLMCTVGGNPTGFIKRWFADPHKLCHTVLEVAPPPAALTPNAYNIFTGFAADLVDVPHNAPAGSHDMFIELLSVMAQHVPNVITYITNALAHLIQRPGERMNVMMFLYSPNFVQGTGKSLFLSTFGRFIIGLMYFIETANLQDLIGAHAEGLENKLLALLEESCRTATSQNRSQLYHAITAETVVINPKYQKPRTLKSFVRLVSTTNFKNAVEAGRRFFITPCSFELKDNTMFFIRYYAYISRPENQRAIIKYLRSVDISGWHAERDMPVTEVMAANLGAAVPPETLLMLQVCRTMVRKGVPSMVVANKKLARSLIKFYTSTTDDTNLEREYNKALRTLPCTLNEHAQYAPAGTIVRDDPRGGCVFTFNLAKLRAYLEDTFKLTMDEEFTEDDLELMNVMALDGPM